MSESKGIVPRSILEENKKTFQTATHKVTYSRFVGFHIIRMKEIALVILVAVFVIPGLVVETDCEPWPPRAKPHAPVGLIAERMQLQEKREARSIHPFFGRDKKPWMPQRRLKKNE
ncbi:uncharacterized protein [Montipora foliosa]|uniref:uncharacterized protein n=1 Tax=Montipora foliosa TaxID=591990 RepID=UPI0035F1EB29